MSNNTAYCVKCRQRDRKMVDCTEKRSSNGRLMLQGTCEKCGTKMNKFIKDPLAGTKKVSEKNNSKEKKDPEEKSESSSDSD